MAILIMLGLMVLHTQAVRVQNAEVAATSGRIYLELINNSSLPINLLLQPDLLPVYAEAKNHLSPGLKVSFVPFMGYYQYHVVLDDGNNTWESVDEWTWSLTKYSVTKTFSKIIDFLATKELALVATAAISAKLAPFLAPAALMAVTTAFGVGTVFTTGMAVSALTNGAMDMIRDLIKRLQTLPALPRLGSLESGIFNRTDPNRLLRFDDVVTENSVRSSFAALHPTVDTSKVLLTQRFAEVYMHALLADFRKQVWAGRSSRTFIVTGGFTEPVQVPGTHWWKTTFEPLSFGELSRGRCSIPLHVTYFMSSGSTASFSLSHNWDGFRIAEKMVTVSNGQTCKKVYVGMCKLGTLRVLTECPLPVGSQGDVTQDIWEENIAERKDRSLSTYYSRRTSIHKGEHSLRILVDDGPGSISSELSLRRVSFKLLDSTKCHRPLAIFYTTSGTRESPTMFHLQDWESVGIAEKMKLGPQGQPCRETYTAICALGVLRVKLECQLAISGTYTWETLRISDRRLKGSKSFISLKRREHALHLTLPHHGPGQNVSLSSIAIVLDSTVSCQRSLLVSFKNASRNRHLWHDVYQEVVVPTNWEDVPIVEKSCAEPTCLSRWHLPEIPGLRCKKVYSAMCAQEELKVKRLCHINGSNASWAEVDDLLSYRSLSTIYSRQTSLHDGEDDMRLLLNNETEPLHLVSKVQVRIVKGRDEGRRRGRWTSVESSKPK
eukprot:TRINITY_DN73548_c0_g1_i1.p1 TRINITY_DN73548_c0_g1~~TRINITY_DN73548_c0_g1_i1.p1  ORF type:complete len:720 (-),score=70.14 TRINITY_DN73548_c0_g1_i1:481-2640(-)